MSANPFGVRGQRSPGEFAEWNSANRRARNAYLMRCECGYAFANAQGLAVHQTRYCKLRAS